MAYTTEDPPPIVDFIPIREAEVYIVLKQINVSKSSGLTNVGSFVIKEAFSAVIPEITRLFNLSLDLSKFPSQWKSALVIPIPKSGNLSNVQNYRPISLLPLPGKILEKLVHQQLSHHLERNLLLSQSQHGFRKKHSTIHSVAQLTKYVNTKLDAGLPTLAAYIDFRKAFDCVQHGILINKLANLNFGRTIIDWVTSYLTDRKQRVLANGENSSFLHITQGVPQGSVLGPLFYIAYENDLSLVLKNCDIALYADDTILYTANLTFGESISKLQGDISSLALWCGANGVSVNTDKTKIMTFGSPRMLEAVSTFEITYNNKPLHSVSSYKYLGVTLDNHLNYNCHVTKLISLASSKLKQFQRMRSFLNVRAAIMVYKSMLLPLLEYGDVFLSATSKENRKKLQTLQNKGLRCALNKGIETSREELHREAGLLTLSSRREQHLMNFMFDWSWDPQYVKVPHEPTITTRSQKKRLLKLKKTRTEKYKKCLSYCGPKKWNALPTVLHEAVHKPVFKSQISKWITQNATLTTKSKSKFKSKSKSKSKKKPDPPRKSELIPTPKPKPKPIPKPKPKPKSKPKPKPKPKPNPKPKLKPTLKPRTKPTLKRHPQPQSQPQPQPQPKPKPRPKPKPKPNVNSLLRQDPDPDPGPNPKPQPRSNADL